VRVDIDNQILKVSLTERIEELSLDLKSFRNWFVYIWARQTLHSHPISVVGPNHPYIRKISKT